MKKGYSFHQPCYKVQAFKAPLNKSHASAVTSVLGINYYFAVNATFWKPLKAGTAFSQQSSKGPF